MNSFSRRVSFLIRLAKDEFLAKAMAHSFMALSQKALSDLSINTKWDGGAERVKSSPGVFSFRFTPDVFRANKLTGGLQVDGEYLDGDGLVFPSDHDLNGELVEVKLRVSFYHKKPTKEGEKSGKVDPSTSIDCGTHLVDFDLDGKPTVDESNIGDLEKGLRTCIQRLIENPPEAALEGKNPTITDGVDNIKGGGGGGKKAPNSDGPASPKTNHVKVHDSHKSIPDFVELMKSKGKDRYNINDMIALQQYTKKSKDEIKAELLKSGLKPSNSAEPAHTASDPIDIALELKSIADRLDLSMNPSRSAVIAAVRRVISKI